MLFALWGITTPSYWRDEAATIAAVSRPFGDMIRMLGNVDAVHSLYYMMIWPIAHAFGTGPLVLRFPSAVAAAVAAWAVAAIGRRLISQWAGVIAGLILAVLPVTSRYAQEVRSNEMVVAVATVASLVLIRLLASAPEQRRRWAIGYGASIGLLGVLNVFGLLLVPAHAVTVAVRWRRDSRDPAVRSLAVLWFQAAAAGVVIASPLLVLGWLQRAQIAWLSANTSSSGLSSLFSLSGSYIVTTTIIGITAVALVLGMERTKAQRQASWPSRLVDLGVPWLVVPPILLLAGSLVHPVYTSRYVLMCMPAVALILGAAIATFGEFAGSMAVVMVLTAGAITQLAVRTPAGHFDDIRALDAIVATHARPGDAVLYTNPNADTMGYAYQGGLGSLPDVGISAPRIPSGTLAGTPASFAEIRSRLLHYKRVWVVEINTFNGNPSLDGLNGEPVASGQPIMDGLPFTFTTMWRARSDYIILFTHQ